MADKSIFISGGAGFVGSHLCKHYLDNGWKVVCADNLSTGRKINIEPLHSNPNFTFAEIDICKAIPSEYDQKYDVVANLASPASPPHYYRLAVETIMVGVVGTKNMLDLAEKHGARFFQASTSEVYGDPEVHPQTESYKGSVNCYGPRAMYDEAKRAAEALIYVYQQQRGVSACIARFFNTYGPNMDPLDGRVVSNFIVQALRGEKLSVYGDGQQTRSFCYIDDLIDGITKLIDSNESEPMNLGNPGEFTILELAEKVKEQVGLVSEVIHLPLPGDDPTQRKPDISFAKRAFGWEPKVALDEGLEKTIEYFRTQI